MRRHAVIAAAFLAVLSGLLAACTGRPIPTPRPHAFPRAELYPQSYRAVPLPFGPDSIAVNDSATFRPGPDGWFDIIYPAYGITINCTLTRAAAPADIPHILDNRLERMRLNLGDRRAHIADRDGKTLIVAPSALRTPVQFLATDSATYVLSGVAVADFPPLTDPDSVAPAIDAVAADIALMLNNL